MAGRIPTPPPRVKWWRDPAILTWSGYGTVLLAAILSRWP